MVKATAFHIRNVSEGPFLVFVALWLELSLENDNEAERNPFLRRSPESRGTRLLSKELLSFSPHGAGFKNVLLTAAFRGVKKGFSRRLKPTSGKVKDFHISEQSLSLLVAVISQLHWNPLSHRLHLLRGCA